MSEDNEKKEVTLNPEAFDPEQYVMIARFIEPLDAQIAKGVLESASLEYFLHGENANNLLAPAFRSRLMVHKKDEEIARKLLETPVEPESLEPESMENDGE
jgi:hypothetical protein